MEKVCNGDRLQYANFDELTDDLKEKYKVLNTTSRSKRCYTDFINLLNKNEHTLVSDYGGEKVVIDFHCGHEPFAIRASGYKQGHGCMKCANERRRQKSKEMMDNMTEEEKRERSKKISDAHHNQTDEKKQQLSKLRSEYMKEYRANMTDEEKARRSEIARQNTIKQWERMTEEDRIRYRQTRQGLFKGDKNPNWQGGKTPIVPHMRTLICPLINEFKKQKNYTCDVCGKYDEGIDAHHLYGFTLIIKDAHVKYDIECKETIGEYTEEDLLLIEEYVLNWHIANTDKIILLCPHIHELFHKQFGKEKDITREQYEEFKKLLQ